MRTYVEVVPLRSLPRGKDVYTYEISPELHCTVGQLVRIPFRHQTINGVIWRILEQEAPPPYSVRPVLAKVPGMLTEGQRSLLERIATFYGGSRTTLLRSIITLQQKSGRIQEYHNQIPDRYTSTIIVSSTRDVLETIAKRIRTDYHGQYCIVAPTTEIAFEIARSMRTMIDAECILLEQSNRRSEQRAALTTVLQNSSYRSMIIIGTRRVLFLPFETLQGIIIVDEQNAAHRQWDREPRIDNRVVAEWLAQYWGASLYYTTPFPSLWSFQKTIEPPWLFENSLPQLAPSTLHIPDQQMSDQDPFWIAWLRQQFERGPTLIVTSTALSANGALECRTCFLPVRCSTCYRRISEESPEGTASLPRWLCMWCKSSVSIPRCPRCNGTRFLKRSSKFQTMTRIIEPHFPEESIREVSESTCWSAGGYRLGICPLSNRAAFIDRLRWNRDRILPFSSLLFWDIERSELPGYRYDELIWSRFYEVVDIARAQPSLSVYVTGLPKIILSSVRDPEPITSAMAWLRQEYIMRSLFGYPPAGHMILLDTHREVAHNDGTAATIIAAVKNSCGISLELITSTGALARRKAFRSRTITLLKVPHIAHQEWQRVLAIVNRELPSAWSITPDPEQLPGKLPTLFL